LHPVTEGFSLSAATKSQNRETGFARFSVTPPQSSITWQLDGGTEMGSAKEGERISLPPGRYLVTVSADQYKVRQETITIASGADVSFDWSLSPADAPHAPLPAPNARSVGFEALEGNLANDGEGWFVSKSRFTLLKNSEAGVFYFNMRFPGVLRKRAFWVVNYQNEKNYVQFEIDEKNITMSVVADGQTREGKPVPHQLVKYDYYYTLSVQVDQHQVIFGGLQNGSYTRFYNWTSPTDNLIERRFGFRGDVALNGFRFQASQ